MSSRPGQTTPPSPPSGPFVDLEVLKNADGLLAVISQRRANGVITFAFFRDFERDGQIDRTSFIASRYLDSFMELVKLTHDRIVELQTDPAKLEAAQAKVGFKPDARTERPHSTRRHGARP